MLEKAITLENGRKKLKEVDFPGYNITCIKNGESFTIKDCRQLIVFNCFNIETGGCLTIESGGELVIIG